MGDKERVFGEGASDVSVEVIKQAIMEPQFWAKTEDCVITVTKVLYDMVLNNPGLRDFELLTEEQYDEIQKETGASTQAMVFADTIRGIVGQLVTATWQAKGIAIALGNNDEPDFEIEFIGEPKTEIH